MITFEEDQSHGYRERTIKNASADLTLAFATDFLTSGERLTKSSVPKNKKYIAVPVDLSMNQFNTITMVQRELFGYTINTVNIAGNGIYTLKGAMTQEQCDNFVFHFLTYLFVKDPIHERKIKLIRSGGQTGFDESGLKAAVRLGIPALCLAPKGWKFRDITGTDICDEKQFKARFL